MPHRSDVLPLAALHVTVLLWGATAILGKLISYGSLSLVWHRMSIAFLAYCLVPGNLREIWSVPGRHVAIFFGIGAVVCAHWIMFYTSVKLGDSASITLACCGSVSFFSAVCEPMLLGQAISRKDLGVGVVVLAGILLIYLSLPASPSTGGAAGERPVHYEGAVLTGLAASFLGTVFTVLNKKYIKLASSVAIATIEMASGSILLTLSIPVLNPFVFHEHTVLYPTLDLHHLTLDKARAGPFDLIWVLILAVFCTNITFYLSMFALKHLSAFTVNLVGNMEPVYGILFGALFFHENESLNVNFYLGTAVILLAIFSSAALYTAHPRPSHCDDNNTTAASASICARIGDNSNSDSCEEVGLLGASSSCDGLLGTDSQRLQEMVGLLSQGE